MDFKTFYRTQLGKIINHTIHDHNNAIGAIRTRLFLFKEKVDNGEVPSQEEVYGLIDFLESRCKEAIEAVDYSYIKLKEIEEKKLSNYEN